jgi:hypothetical protein
MCGIVGDCLTSSVPQTMTPADQVLYWGLVIGLVGGFIYKFIAGALV